MQILRFWKRNALRGALVIVLVMAAFNYNITRPIVDSFHEGEYLGALWTIRSYLSGTTPYPLLVHGSMDYIPALIAGALSNDQSTIVLTRAINTGIACITWILFLDLLMRLLRGNEYRFAAGLVSVALFVGMIVIVPDDAVERQQTFLAIRDLFLIAGLWCTFWSLSTPSLLTRHARILLSGAILAASLYWAYDRFLASVAFGGALVLALLLQREWKLAATIIVGGGVALFIVPLFAPTGSLAENAANLIYWLKYSSDVWHLPILTRVPAIPTAVAMIVLLFIFTRTWVGNRSKRGDGLPLAFVAGLLALQLFFLLKYLNLPRQPNNYYFVWPFVLLLAAVPFRWPLWRKFDDKLRDLWTAMVERGGIRQPIGLVAVALSLAVIVSNNMAVATANNLRSLINLPKDTDLLPTAIAAATRNVSLPADGCVLLWSNEGVFVTALRRPFCTRYMYSVYVSADQEEDLLRQIQAAPPALVVFDSPFWSMNIFRRTMQQRLPKVDRYLRENYHFSYHDGYMLGERQSQ